MPWDVKPRKNELDEMSMGSIRPNAPQETVPPEVYSNAPNAGLGAGMNVTIMGKRNRPSLYKALGRKK